MMSFMMVASNMTLPTSPDHNQTDKASKQDHPPPPLLLSQPHRIPSPYSSSISTPSSKPPAANHISPHHEAFFVPPIKLHLSSHHLHHETVKLTKAKSEPKFTTLFFQVNRVRHSRHNLHKTIRMLSQWGIMGLWDLKHWTEIPRNHEGFFCCNFKLGLREEGKSRKEPTGVEAQGGNRYWAMRPMRRRDGAPAIPAMAKPPKPYRPPRAPCRWIFPVIARGHLNRNW